MCVTVYMLAKLCLEFTQKICVNTSDMAKIKTSGPGTRQDKAIKKVVFTYLETGNEVLGLYYCLEISISV